MSKTSPNSARIEATLRKEFVQPQNTTTRRTLSKTSPNSSLKSLPNPSSIQSQTDRAAQPSFRPINDDDFAKESRARG